MTTKPTAEVSVEELVKDKIHLLVSTACDRKCCRQRKDITNEIIELLNAHTTALKGRVVDGIDEVVDMLDAQGHISPQHSVDEVKSKLKTFITNIT